MKTLQFFLAFSLLWSITAWAQEPDAPKRDIELKVIDRKGLPVKKMMVQSTNMDKSGVTDRAGRFVFKDISDNDTISIVSPKYGAAVIPVAGMDSIIVTFRSEKQYSYVNQDGKDASFAYMERMKIKQTTVIDVQELLKFREYNSLIEVLQGRVTGLNVNSGSGTTTIRGERSVHLKSEPLVVLNGMPMGELKDVNLFVNIRDVKTIEVLKSASEWGSRGANGVILISTK